MIIFQIKISKFNMEILTAKNKVDEFEWEDADKSELSEIPIAVIDFIPSQENMKYYKRFRYSLQTQQHNSERVFHLTTLMLTINTTNYYALMLRKNNWDQAKFPLIQEIKFMNQLLETNPKEYHLWTYKKQLFGKQENGISPEIVELQEKFLQELLVEDNKNYHVWDYRMYLTLHFHNELRQIQKSEVMIFAKLPQPSENVKMTNLWVDCNSLWSYRFNLMKLQPTQIQQKLLERQPKLIRDFLELHPRNEPTWNYLSGMNFQFPISQEQKQKNIELARKLSKQKNRFALNMLLLLGSKDERKQVIKELLVIDSTRKLYYEYLLENQS